MVKSLEAGKLIVGAIAISIDPTGTAATVLGIDTALQFKAWFQKAPDLEKLSAELGKKFDTRLKERRYDRPVAARALLPQMLEASMPKAKSIAECGLDADLIFAQMEKVLESKDSEYRKLENASAFKDLILPLLKEACDDPRLKSALDPALIRQQMKSQRNLADQLSEMNAKLDRHLAQSEDLLGIIRKPAESGSIDPDTVLTLPELELLADRFGGVGLTTQESIVQFLTQKAQEYEALKTEVDSIDEGMKRLSNLKGAAQGAIARVDLEEVEEILSRVQEVELEEAAKTAELRANNALLRGQVEQAFQILSAAADSFAAVDALEPARRRISYEDRLYAHGLRYGGQGMALSETMLRKAINDLDKTNQAELWASAQNSLAIALRNQGTRTAGEAGTTLLEGAVNAYHNALTIRTETDYPMQWAMIQNNIGLALKEQGARTAGAASTTLLADAVTAHRAALTVCTEGDHPVQWAMTQNNLAIALQNQGTRTAGVAGTTLLADAVSAYRAALTVHAKADHPVQWAGTQNNLGGALQIQGSRTDGAAGTILLADAVAAYRAALTVYTEARHPVQWAMTQENLAITEIEIANHETTTDPRPHLEAALAHVDAALTVYDPEHMSYDHGTATRLRDQITSQLENLS